MVSDHLPGRVEEQVAVQHRPLGVDPERGRSPASVDRPRRRAAGAAAVRLSGQAKATAPRTKGTRMTRRIIAVLVLERRRAASVSSEANSRLMWNMTMPITKTAARRSSSTPGLDHHRHEVGEQQAEDEDPVLEHQEAEHLGRPPCAGVTTSRRPVQTVASAVGTRKGCISGDGQRQAAGEGEGQHHAHAAQDHGRHEADQRLHLAPDGHLADGPEHEPGDEDRLDGEGAAARATSTWPMLVARTTASRSGSSESSAPCSATARMAAPQPARGQHEEVEDHHQDEDHVGPGGHVHLRRRTSAKTERTEAPTSICGTRVSRRRAITDSTTPTRIAKPTHADHEGRLGGPAGSSKPDAERPAGPRGRRRGRA